MIVVVEWFSPHNGPQFSIWETIIDRFRSFNGSQGWSSLKEFYADLYRAKELGTEEIIGDTKREIHSQLSEWWFSQYEEESSQTSRSSFRQ